MTGIGYGIIKRGSDYYYSCNFHGHTFEFKANIKDIKITEIEHEEEAGKDEFGEDVTRPAYTETQISYKDGAATRQIIEDYVNNTILKSKEFDDFYIAAQGFTNDKVELCADEDAIKTTFDKVDYTLKEIDGNTKSVIECLFDATGKRTIKMPNGKYIVEK